MYDNFEYELERLPIGGFFEITRWDNRYRIERLRPKDTSSGWSISQQWLFMDGDPFNQMVNTY